MSVSLTFRCPDDLAALITSHVEATGQDRTSVVVGMLRSSLPSLLMTEKNNLPEISAVYLVWSSNNLLYIGKTTNLRNRFFQHHRIVQFVEAGTDTRIGWFPVAVDGLTYVEDSLIELLEPEFNGEAVIGVKLATFRIEPEKWKAFKSLATNQGTNASAVLNEFIDKCLAERRIPSDVSTLVGDDSNLINLIDKRIEDSIEALIDKRIENSLAVSLGEVRSQLEELRGKSKAR
ncbi:GIY-YIG nuclease family protein [Nostoc sp.]|uniref:GIY-YIG nuclease family protein n=1 Tax=Nostoc sp. TaxID=1180 RepID=UPI002FFC13CE